MNGNNGKATPANPGLQSGSAPSVKERFGILVDRYLFNGSIVIAAITSCSNTSILGHGRRRPHSPKAVEKGLKVPPWVKTSLA